MIRWFTLTAMFAAGLFLWSGVGSAETVQGKIVEIDPNQKALTVNRMDVATGQLEQVKLEIDNDTAFAGGIDSLASLKVGDEISVEADQNFVTRQWTANSIQRGLAAAEQAPPGQGQAGQGRALMTGSRSEKGGGGGTGGGY